MQPEIKYFINDLPSDLELKGSIAIDTEAMGLKYNIRDRLCVVQLCDENGLVCLVHFPDNKYDCPNLKKILINKNK